MVNSPTASPGDTGSIHQGGRSPGGNSPTVEIDENATGSQMLAQQDLLAMKLRRELEREAILHRLEGVRAAKKKMKAQRGGHQGIITAADTRWGNIMAHMHLIGPTHITEMGLIVEKVEHALDKYKDISNRLFEDCADAFQDNELEKEMVRLYEIEQAYTTRAKLQNLLDSSGDSTTSPGLETTLRSVVSPDLGREGVERGYIKTPTIDIPVFSGEYSQWASFHDLFTSVISQSKMAGSSKLAYLKSLLKGDALVTIRSFPLTDSNYVPAMDALKKRFENKRVIVAQHIDNLFSSFPVSSDSNGLQMHRILERFNENLSCLDQQGIDDATWKDQVLIHVLVSKLPEDTRRQWGLFKQGTDLQTWQELKDWLTNRATALENTGKQKESYQKPQHKTPGNRSGVRTGLNFAEVTSKEKYSCPLCKTPHALHSCAVFRKQDQFEKYKSAKDSSTCFNCLSSTQHSAQNCPNKGVCRAQGCGKKHHTLLHREFVSSGNSNQTQGSGGAGGTVGNVGGNVIQIHCEGVYAEATSTFAGTTQASQVNETFSTVANVPEVQAESRRSTEENQKDNSVEGNKFRNAQNNEIIFPVIAAGAPFSNPNPNRAIVLGTVSAKVLDGRGKEVNVRILLDNGSQGNFISEKCMKRLGLSRRKSKLAIQPVGPNSPHSSNGVVRLKFKPPYSVEPMIVEALVMSRLVDPTPALPLELRYFQKLNQIQLADPGFDTPGEIDILFGIETYNEILVDEPAIRDQKIRFEKTIFGYAATGAAMYKNDEIDVESSFNLSVFHASILKMPKALEIAQSQEDIDRFWGTEDLPIPFDVLTGHSAAARFNAGSPNYSDPLVTIEQRRAVDHFDRTTIKNSDNRLIVGLPFRPDSPELGYSFSSAFKQFKSLEKRLTGKPETYILYRAFIKEYLDLGHLVLVPDHELNKPYNLLFYIPHHWVEKDSTTTKLRTVYNASMPTSTGTSLNDLLDVGPKLQDDLWYHTIRFQFYPVALTADITKMYRQVELNPEAQDYHRILWRDSETEEVRVYRMTVVTYGVASSSYHAIRALWETTNDPDCPEEVRIAIRRSFYVDDFLGGHWTFEGAVNLQKQIHAHLLKYNFELRKWSSNEFSIIANLPEKLRENAEAFNIGDEKHSLKTLGLRWIPSIDCFQFRVEHIEEPIPDKMTKRQLLSEISHVFDPIGWLIPVSLALKLLMQTAWVQGLPWDTPLPTDLIESYSSLRDQLPALRELSIPRCVLPPINDLSDIGSIQLHVFCDASELAYGAVIYTRVITVSGVIKVSLLTAKSRVAPLKSQSIPRLELCAALLGAKLMKAVLLAIESFPLTISEIYAWTDSTIVLCWLEEVPRHFTTFVANRISQIQELLPRALWFHVGSKSNPADVATRGIDAALFKEFSLWWNGPDWLLVEPFVVPEQPTFKASQVERKKQPLQIKDNHPSKSFEPLKISLNGVRIIKDDECEKTDDALSLQRFSSFKRWVRVTSHVLKFFQSFKCIEKRLQNTSLGPIQELSIRFQAVRLAISREQAQYFSEEIKTLNAKKQLPKNHQLCGLYPFIDNDDGILKVGGRLSQAAYLSEQVKYPAILPKQGELAKLLIYQTHKDMFHAGTQACMAELRTQFWIIGLRNAVRLNNQNCVTCKRYNSRPPEPLMGDLPKERVTPSAPFEHTGIDFAGPLYLQGPNKKLNKLKVYVAVLVCFTTKAIHLELVSDLSGLACLAAFRRFVARRGCPKSVYSDGGTNFTGARKELRQLSEVLVGKHGTTLSNYVIDIGSKWNIIPPGAPHFGGLWESAVRLMKSHLKKVVGKNLLNFEELNTLLTEIESVLNSRPLVELTNDPLDLEVLTPAMLLTGRHIRYLPTDDTHHPIWQTIPPAPNHIDDEVTTANQQKKHTAMAIKRWNHIQTMCGQFWQRWVKEYIPTLQTRKKWKVEIDNFQVGDIVLLTDENTPPLHWPLGRILRVYDGNDNVIRVVQVKTARGTYNRPVVKLRKLILAIEDEEQSAIDFQADVQSSSKTV